MMKVFTVFGGTHRLGTEVSKPPFYNQDDLAIVIGNDDNGCKLGIVKLVRHNNPTEIFACSIGSENGKFVVQPTTSSKNDFECLVVLRTQVYKGGKNYHTGDRKRNACHTCELDYGITQENCTECGKKLKVYYQDFPGQILARGTIRDSKKRVFGNQLVCVVKKNQVFRTAYDGYTFGKPGSHYHWFDGEKMVTCTWEERLRIYGL